MHNPVDPFGRLPPRRRKGVPPISVRAMNDVMPTAPMKGTFEGSASMADLALDAATVRSAALFDMMNSLAAVAVGHEPDNESVLAVAIGFRHTETADVVRDGMRDLKALNDACAAFASRNNAPSGLYEAVRECAETPRFTREAVVRFGARAFRTKRARTWAALHTVSHPGRPLVEAVYAGLRASTLTKLSLSVIYELVARCLTEAQIKLAVDAVASAAALLVESEA